MPEYKTLYRNSAAGILRYDKTIHGTWDCRRYYNGQEEWASNIGTCFALDDLLKFAESDNLHVCLPGQLSTYTTDLYSFSYATCPYSNLRCVRAELRYHNGEEVYFIPCEQPIFAIPRGKLRKLIRN